VFSASVSFRGFDVVPFWALDEVFLATLEAGFFLPFASAAEVLSAAVPFLAAIGSFLPSTLALPVFFFGGGDGEYLLGGFAVRVLLRVGAMMG